MKKKKRYVNIIGSSLTLPRSWANQYYEDTWAYLLFSYLNENTSDLWQVFNNAKYGLLVSKDFNKSGINKMILNYPSEILILGFGGSDRLPEAMPPKIKRLTKIMPKILKSKVFEYYNVNNLKILQKKPNYEFTFEQYEKAFETVLSFTNNQFRIFISLPQMPLFCRTVPGYTEQLRLINESSKKVIASNGKNIEYLDIWEETKNETLYLEDGAHLNKLGHVMIFEKIKEKLNKYLESKNG